MKKNLTLILIGAALIISTALAINFGDIPLNTPMSVVKIYRYNAGSAPTLTDYPIVFVGTATTDAGGVATFQLTMDGTGSGTAMFTNIRSMTASVQNNTATAIDIPIASIKALASGKTVTVNSLEGINLIALGPTVGLSGSGLTVNLTVIGD